MEKKNNKMVKDIQNEKEKEMIKNIRNKIAIETRNVLKLCNIEEKNVRQFRQFSDVKKYLSYYELTNEELLKNKVIYSNEELDFILYNYHDCFHFDEPILPYYDEAKIGVNGNLFKNCLYLINEFKQTKQDSKCNAVYNILNKYFTVQNAYEIGLGYSDTMYPGMSIDDMDDMYVYTDYSKWDGFEMTTFARCSDELEEMINAKVEKIKADKKRQKLIEYKEKADKEDKEIIEGLEL